jgi:hypothetical protein
MDQTLILNNNVRKNKNIGGGGGNMCLCDLMEEKITKVGLYLNTKTRDLKRRLLILILKSRDNRRIASHICEFVT